MFINDNGDIKEIGVKAFDTLPVGAEIDYNGTEVPDGWEEINNPNEYSIEEKVIGIYENEDGTKQPLYRKIIDTSDNSSNILHGISNLKNVITCKGNIKRTSSEVVSQLFPHIDTNINYNVDVNYFSSTTIYLLIGTGILSSITGFRLILEYTKTTD